MNSKNCDECYYLLSTSPWKDRLLPYACLNGISFCPFNSNANVLTLYKTHGRTFENFAHTLSVKSIYNGSERFEIKGEKHDLQNNSYLVVNETAEYVSSIDKNLQVETFCLSFGKNYMKEAFASFTSAVENALTDGRDEEFQAELPHFLTMVNYSDIFMDSIIQSLRQNASTETPDGWFEDICLSVIRHLVERHRKISFKIDNIPAVKESTRVEIFKRLNMAKNFVKNNFQSEINLETMAEAAYLSKFRFLRYFKQAFGITPHQYINQCRLEQAKSLIITSKRSITDIAYDVGFKTPNHFSRLFLSRFGFSPNTLRK